MAKPRRKCIEGLDTMTIYKPVGEKLPPLAYDTTNYYGLNDYFQNHPELDIEDVRAGAYVRAEDTPCYFAKRLPKLKNGDEALLYVNEGSDYNGKYKAYWQLITCNPSSGKITGSSYLMWADNSRYSIVYLYDNNNVYKKSFVLPDLQHRKKYAYININFDRISEVSDYIKNNKLTILSYEGAYNLNNKDKRSYEYVYFWQNNKPVRCQNIDNYKGSNKQQICIVRATDTIPIDREGNAIEVGESEK